MTRPINFRQILPLVFLLSSPAAATAPDGVYISAIETHGPGCPDGSVTAGLSNDGQALTLIFDEYAIDHVGTFPDGSHDVQSSSCDVDIALHAPEGWIWGVVSTQIRGYAWLEEGAYASLYARIQAGSGSSTDNISMGNIRVQGTRNAFDDLVQMNHDIDVASVHWSDCSQREYPLRFSTRANVGTILEDYYGYFSVDSFDTSITQEYNISWKRCSDQVPDSRGNNLQGEWQQTNGNDYLILGWTEYQCTSNSGIIRYTPYTGFSNGDTGQQNGYGGADLQCSSSSTKSFRVFAASGSSSMKYNRNNETLSYNGKSFKKVDRGVQIASTKPGHLAGQWKDGNRTMTLDWDRGTCGTGEDDYEHYSYDKPNSNGNFVVECLRKNNKSYPKPIRFSPGANSIAGWVLAEGKIRWISNDWSLWYRNINTTPSGGEVPPPGDTVNAGPFQEPSGPSLNVSGGSNQQVEPGDSIAPVTVTSSYPIGRSSEVRILANDCDWIDLDWDFDELVLTGQAPSGSFAPCEIEVLASAWGKETNSHTIRFSERTGPVAGEWAGTWHTTLSNGVTGVLTFPWDKGSCPDGSSKEVYTEFVIKWSTGYEQRGGADLHCNNGKLDIYFVGGWLRYGSVRDNGKMKWDNAPYKRSCRRSWGRTSCSTSWANQTVTWSR